MFLSQTNHNSVPNLLHSSFPACLFLCHVCCLQRHLEESHSQGSLKEGWESMQSPCPGAPKPPTLNGIASVGFQRPWKECLRLLLPQMVTGFLRSTPVLRVSLSGLWFSFPQETESEQRARRNPEHLHSVPSFCSERSPCPCHGVLLSTQLLSDGDANLHWNPVLAPNYPPRTWW